MPPTPADLLRRAVRAAHAQAPAPVFLGSVPVLDLDRKRGALMAETRRLFNEGEDRAWGREGERHRGDEATQAKTWADGCLGEAVLGRLFRSIGSKRVHISAPVEWNPAPDPDLLYDGPTVCLRADFKSASYKRADGSTSWTVNKKAHDRSDVDGYLAADLANSEDNVLRLWFYTKAAVEAGDLLHRKALSGTDSSFYRMFFPPVSTGD